MNKRPLVSIVTINYNQAEVTCEMLESFRRVTYPAYEIIVVDNDSPTAPDIIEQRYPEVKLIRSKSNLGFAGGNNLGIDAASGEYILFLNNDTEVEPGFIEPIVELMESDRSIGMVSPKIKFFYHRDTVQYAGYSKFNIFTISMTGYGFKQKDDGRFDKLLKTNFCHGAAMMVPMEVIRKVGKMPDLYFLYYEEHDWAMRVKNAGYSIYYLPDSTVWHKESISTGKQSALKTYYFTRNRILFGRRNISGIAALLSMAYMVLVAIPKNLVVYLLKFDIKHMRAYAFAIWWHIKRLHKRFYVNDFKKHSNQAIKFNKESKLIQPQVNPE
ncbi:MAG: glycosyltransferase family 2 protein [Bacteroidales bacterium]|nr:glycosyltransferase family 2 protein [Bacteroidales bacterium]